MSKKFIDVDILLKYLENIKQTEEKKSMEAAKYKQNIKARIADTHCAFCEKLADYIKTANRSEEIIDSGYLEDWYINSIDDTIPPIWTTEHIEELLNDFYVIPKKERNT